MRRGDIWWAVLHPRSGSEQSGRRPVVVLSHDSFNQSPNWKSVIVIPCSSSERQARRTPTCVPLVKGVGGLPQDCVAICHQITTLDRSKLEQQIGYHPEAEMRAIEAAVRNAIDFHSDQHF